MHSKQPILATVAIFILALAAPAVFAETKIGVVDVQSAILQSEEAKRLLKQIQDEFKDEESEIRAVQSERVALYERLQKDNEVMSASEKRRLQQQIESKTNDLTYLSQKVQRQIEARQQELFQGIDSKVQKAIEELVLEDDYDLIFHRSHVLWAGDLYDLTRKITEKLNLLNPPPAAKKTGN